MTIERFSPKQLTVLTWWSAASPYRDLDAIICDGAVRSGKTLCMGLSFICWAMRCFHNRQFALCGKTIVSLRRNVVSSVIPVLTDLGFDCVDKISKNMLEISFAGKVNTFYLFGGKDEGSSALIQGSTFAGVLFDEVALMPRSFVEQAIARCSVPGSKLWFNCNPENAYHWFYLEWVKKAAERRALYLHFLMEDNPSLSKRIVARYKRLYSGVFYKRFILGEWASAEGRVYDFFDESYVRDPPASAVFSDFAVSCDYGTANPASFGLWAKSGETWFRIKEFYHDSKVSGFQKTDADYVRDLLKLTEGYTLSAVVVDPSAASFIEALRREGLPVRHAVNDVLSGIRLTADLLKSGGLVIGKDCGDSIREFFLYAWDDKSGGKDAPKKEFDHAMDDIRYFAATVAAPGREDFFAVTAVERNV